MRYLAGGSNASQMLPVLDKHFALIKQKSQNEHMEQATLSLKRPQYYRTDEKLIARYE